MQIQTRAYALALAAVLLWSTVASAFKLSLRVLTHVQLLLYASCVAAAALFVIMCLQRKIHLLKSYTFSDYLRSVLLGILNPFLYYLILFKAYSLLPGQEAQPLNYTWAIVLSILSIPLLGQRIRAASLLAVLVSFCGVLVVATRGDVFSLRFTDPLGVSLALGSSVIWALYWIFNVRDRRDTVVKLFLNFAFGAAITGIYGAATGVSTAVPVPGVLGGVYAGLFEMGLTFVLWLRALRLSRTTAQVSNLIFLSPFVSLVLLHVVAGERIHLSSVTGLILIVGGILLQRRFG